MLARERLDVDEGAQHRGGSMQLLAAHRAASIHHTAEKDTVPILETFCFEMAGAAGGVDQTDA